MATVVAPPQSRELKKVLKLVNNIDHAKHLLETERREQKRNQALLKIAKSRAERQVARSRLTLNSLEIRVCIADIAEAERKLKKLPKLCKSCEGRQLVKTGHMTDDYCFACLGDGLENGPRQRARSRDLVKLLRSPEFRAIAAARRAGACRNFR